jgi:type II secretory pathway pseudopilin PulG
MPVKQARRRGAKRGYLLAESMVAGGIIAVVLSVSVAFVAEGRKSVSTAAARQEAMSLARGKCDEIAATLPTATADQSTLVAVGGNFPGVRWQWATNAAPTAASASTPAIVVAAREITCTVQYPAATGSVDDSASTGAGDGRASITVRKLWFLPQ